MLARPTRLAAPVLLALAGSAAGQSTWLVDSNGGGDFTEIAEAIASPLTTDGDVLVVEPGGYASFMLDEALAIVAPAGQRFSVPAITVSGVASFTLCGFSTRHLTVTGVPGRGRVDDFQVGWPETLTFQNDVGTAVFEDCGQLVVSRGVLRGTDACYPDGEEFAEPAATVTGSNVAFVECDFSGGSGFPEGQKCADHYPTAGAGLRVDAGSDVILAGCSLEGAVGPFGTQAPGLFVDNGVVNVRGSSADTVSAPAGVAPIDGPGGIAVVSGVSLSAGPLPAFVFRPAVAQPWLRSLGPDAPGSLRTVEVFGPAGTPAFAGVSAQPIFNQTMDPASASIWAGAAGLVGVKAVVLAGAEAPSAFTLALPTDPAFAGVGVTVQAFLLQAPQDSNWLTSPQDLVLRW